MKRKVSANIKLKRVYEPPADDDGTRILIDRLWLRGLSKERAAIDQWMKDIAPSTELRKWFAAGTNFGAAIPKRYTNTPSSWINCDRSHVKAQSRWCVRRMMRSITMPSN